jgi:preprotein translocase subunit SecG
MLVFIYALIVLVCIFLSLIVLVQNPKGGGLDSSFSAANQIGGVKKTGDFLERSTWTLGVVLFVLCLSAAAIHENPVDAAPMFEERVPEMPLDLQQEGGAQEAE